MVEVIYRNRLGNCLFQYCLGRILADGLGFTLRCDPLPGFVNTAERIDGQTYEGPVVEYHLRDELDVDQILSDHEPRRIVLRAWGQQYRYYKQHATAIRRWLSLPPREFGVGPDDILLNLRLGKDYFVRQWIVAPDFYVRSLRRTHFNRVFVSWDSNLATDDFAQDYCRAFSEFNPIFWRSPDSIENFQFIKAFSKIVIAPSTFSWWAAFLSQAKEIFFPDLRLSKHSPWRQHSQGTIVRLEVDEPRYSYLAARTLWD